MVDSTATCQFMTLPPVLSYTPIRVKRLTTDVTLVRRDLFDARFQILSQDDQQQNGVEETSTFFDESSDLVKGVYEGGFKTWECSLDLVDVLARSQQPVRGKSFLEVGCGTAMPSCYIFSRLLQEIVRAPEEKENADWTRLHLQDYNEQVLSHMTLPNLVLTYAQFMASETLGTLQEANKPGELEVSPELIDSFEAFLEQNRIELVFFKGAWQGFHPASSYDVVLTSETVYELASLPSLLDLLEKASAKTDAACLVACKRIYFGVGGGEHEFRRQAEARGATIETVWGDGTGDGRDRGVGRTVMRLIWAGRAVQSSR